MKTLRAFTIAALLDCSHRNKLRTLTELQSSETALFTCALACTNCAADFNSSKLPRVLYTKLGSKVRPCVKLAHIAAILRFTTKSRFQQFKNRSFNKPRGKVSSDFFSLLKSGMNIWNQLQESREIFSSWIFPANFSNNFFAINFFWKKCAIKIVAVFCKSVNFFRRTFFRRIFCREFFARIFWSTFSFLRCWKLKRILKFIVKIAWVLFQFQCGIF